MLLNIIAKDKTDIEKEQIITVEKEGFEPKLSMSESRLYHLPTV